MSKFSPFIFLLFSSFISFSQWTQLNDIPFINHHSNGFGIENKAYIIQGEAGSSGNTIWQYDADADVWEDLGLVPGPARGFSIGDDMDGKYYFGFGTGRNDLWVYDPSTNEFEELPTCPCEGRAHPALVAHNNKIFMGAGSGNNNDLNDWWIYDLNTETWEQKENMPGQRRHHPYQFGIDDAIYVGGGHRGNWLKWDITEETWTAIDDLPGGRVAGTQFSHNGKGFVLSGDQADHSALTDRGFMMYDPETDEWLELPLEEQMHRWACSSFIINDEIYYFGGIGGVSGGNDLNMWKFDLSNINCFAPTRIFLVDVLDTSLNISWSNSSTGMSDHFQYKLLDSQEWTTVETDVTFNTVSGLLPCSTYEFRVHVDCGIDGDVYSEIETIQTKGCGACVDNSFCDISDYWPLNGYIESVSINEYQNISGNNDGFEEFTNSSEVEINIGEEFQLEIEPGFTSSNQVFNLKAWMDLNNDGTFGDDELLFSEIDFSETFVASIRIPEDASPGLSRLRIILNFNDIDGPCEVSIFNIGEAEDYCLTLIAPLTSAEEIDNALEDQIDIFPNPFKDQVNIVVDNPGLIKGLSIEDINGSFIHNRSFDANRTETKIELAHLNIPAGIYIMRLFAQDGKQVIAKKIIKY